jgi:uncharacterized protein YbjT (DUF2867 family)
MFAIAGVSGHTGRVAAETLLKEGKKVRVIVRDAKKAEEWKTRGAEVAVAELDDVAGLTRALTGAEGAYLLLPPHMASTQARQDNAKRTAGCLQAIDASGVGHVVFLSSVGAQHASGTGPILSVHDAEAALGESRANVTFLRAAYFLENWGGSLYALGSGKLPTFVKADLTIPMVATEDIGRSVAQLLVEGGKGKSVVELSGPKDYSPKEIATALSSITGKTVVAEEGPEAAIVGAMTSAGMNAHWAGLFAEMIHGVNTGHVAFEGGRARAIRGTVAADAVLRRLVA